MKSLLRKTIVAGSAGRIRLTGETGRRLVAEAQAQGGESLLEVIEHVTTAVAGSRSTVWETSRSGAPVRYSRRSLKRSSGSTVFRDGDVFWDVGANIGVYTLYAAMTRQSRGIGIRAVGR